MTKVHILFPRYISLALSSFHKSYAGKPVDQQLISMFKYYNECDRIFAYIKEDEGEVDDEFLFDEGSSIYY
ncbi:hypothetical protein RMATCC62417_09337 [Rhizopus microsporus]|nr:hypothetical protein RMATCC62417_09337 [Rhizopus microsporus]